jgi:hypothetical protein
MVLSLRYGVLSKSAVVFGGAGRTRNVSRTGVLFQADARLPVGSAVELSIKWPVLRDGRQPVELVVFGNVIRAGDSHAAVSITHYEFLPVCPLDSLDTAQGLRPMVRRLLRKQNNRVRVDVN